jgi:hypothetical protein
VAARLLLRWTFVPEEGATLSSANSCMAGAGTHVSERTRSACLVYWARLRDGSWLETALGGHPNPASSGHLKTGQLM